MKYLDINGKFIRKDPKYYLRDVLEYPEYDGSYERLEKFLDNVEEEYEIHIINTGCIAAPLLEVFKEYDQKSELINVMIDDWE